MTSNYNSNNSFTDPSLENMANNTSYDIDSFLDFSGGLSPPTMNSMSSDNLSQPFPAPSFQYSDFPQQTDPLPYTGYNSLSNLSSPSAAATSMSVSPSDQKLSLNSMEEDMSSFFFPGSDFMDPNSMNFDIDEKEIDLDLLAGIKQERSTSNASSISTSSVSRSNLRPQSSRKAAAAPADAATEERIRQILEDVKRRALSNSDDADDGSTPLPHLARMKKDEEDMDEDERLLASEEGKKLSSKERRQLRNKVSARAFRSRRKEYIGQLENEVAMKSNESAELREKLRTVEAENKSLKDLTRMLLASPQFSSFLDQLHPTTANNGLNLAAMTVPPAQNENISVHRATIPDMTMQVPVDFTIPTYIPPQQYMNTYNPHKDTNPHQVQQGVEDWPLAYSNNTWGIGSTPIYAAGVPTDLIDATELAGKSMFESFDPLAPVDGFRPEFLGGVLSGKEEVQPDYSNCFDKNGQYIYDVYDDELEDVPDYLYDHFEIHAPIGEEKEAQPMAKAEIVLPTLGLGKLFSDLESKFFAEAEVSEKPSSLENSSSSCRSSDLHKTLEAVEHTYRSIGVYCGL